MSLAFARSEWKALKAGSATDSLIFRSQMSRMVNLPIPCLRAAWLSGDFHGPRPQTGHICWSRSWRASEGVTPHCSGSGGAGFEGLGI